MRRCRMRSLTWREHETLVYGLTGGYGDKPTRKSVYCETPQFSDFERLERMGLIKFVLQFPGYGDTM